MNKKLRIALSIGAVIAVIVIVAIYPYSAGAVPEWKFRIIDQDGKPIVGADVEQEWIDPIDDGMTLVGSQTSDAEGWITFPKRPIHNQLAKGSLHFVPSAHIYTCSQGSAGRILSGQLFYYGKQAELADRLVVTEGLFCPFS